MIYVNRKSILKKSVHGIKIKNKLRRVNKIYLRGCPKTGRIAGGSMILTEAAGGASILMISGRITTWEPMYDGTEKKKIFISFCLF